MLPEKRKEKIDLAKRRRRLEDKLSPRHQSFAKLVAVGELSQHEAYMRVFPHAKENSARANASRLRSRPDVSEYIEVLVLDPDWEFVDVAQVQLRLWELAQSTNPSAASAAVNACKALLASLGVRQPPQQIEMTGKDGGPIEQRSSGLSQDVATSVAVSVLGCSEEQARRLLLDDSDDSDKKEIH